MSDVGRIPTKPEESSSTLFVIRSDSDNPRMGDRAHQLIRQRILRGELAEGEHLNESQLAKSLNMSRTPVRHALGLLLQEGLIESTPSRRLVVRSLKPEIRQEIESIREALESISIRRAVEVMSVEEIDELRMLVRRQRRAADAGDENTFLDLDEELHLGIARGARLPLLYRFLAQIGAFVRLKPMRSRRSRRQLNIVANEHERILDALESRDPKRASRLLADHLGPQRMR